MPDDGFIKIVADDRDIVAADRDDVADGRDHSAGERDAAARQRDTDADGRDTDARRIDLDARFRRICDRILEHFARIENTSFDPPERSALDPDSLGALRAFTAEQRRLSRLDHAAITGLLDELRDDLIRRQDDRRAAAHDRRAAAHDRDLAAHDRTAAADDRDLAARDRSQAAIERAQADPTALAGAVHTGSPPPPRPRSLLERAAAVILESRERVTDSRALRGVDDVPGVRDRVEPADRTDVSPSTAPADNPRD